MRKRVDIGSKIMVALTMCTILGSAWCAVTLFGCALRGAAALERIAASMSRIERAGVVTVKTVHVHNTYKGLPDNEVARGISNGR